MSADLTPWKILSATVGVGVLTDGWNLSSPPEDGDACRQFAFDVAFASSFSAPPVVHAGLSGFDLDQSTSPRLSLTVKEIRPDGFAAVLTTWCDTKVHAAEVSWIAIGP